VDGRETKEYRAEPIERRYPLYGSDERALMTTSEAQSNTHPTLHSKRTLIMEEIGIDLKIEVSFLTHLGSRN